jgi:hypothetical protein
MALGFLGRASVIDDMIFEVFGKPFSSVEPFFESGMGNISRNDDRPGERQSSGDGVFTQFCQNFRHRPIQINFDHITVQVLFSHLREVLHRIGFKLFKKYAFFGDLA